MEKILEGDLSRFEVVDLLALLAALQNTGVLVLERADCEAKVFLRGGRPVYATSTADTTRLGALLARSGRVPGEDVDKFLAEPTARGGRLGQALLRKGLLGEDELASLLKVQTSEVVFDVFAWRSGIFSFYDRVPPPTTAVTVTIDPENLVLEAVRRSAGRVPATDLLANGALVLEVLASPERVKQTATLTAEEWRVFFLVDGRRSVEDVCRLAGEPGEPSTLEVISRLVRARLIGLLPPLSAPPPLLAIAGQAEGTILSPEVGVKASDEVSVSFSPATISRQRPEDDTREIVSPKARPYLAHEGGVAMSRLVLTLEGRETSFPLVRDSYSLGRHRNNDIVIGDSKVSSFHARIDRGVEGFALVDLQSRNGTWVNGKRAESVLLNSQDEIRLGGARLIYRLEFVVAAR